MICCGRRAHARPIMNAAGARSANALVNCSDQGRAGCKERRTRSSRAGVAPAYFTAAHCLFYGTGTAERRAAREDPLARERDLIPTALMMLSSRTAPNTDNSDTARTRNETEENKQMPERPRECEDENVTMAGYGRPPKRPSPQPLTRNASPAAAGSGRARAPEKTRRWLQASAHQERCNRTPPLWHHHATRSAARAHPRCIIY